MSRRKWNDEQLIEAAATSHSIYEVMTKLGLKLCGGSHANVKLKIKQLDINTSHFTGQGWCRGEKHKKLIKNFVEKPLSEVLVNESTYQCTHRLKHRLIKADLLKNECYICGSPPIWKGLPLSLQLDHIDGNRTNNTIENLRVLCPNCHSQTPTFTGKNKKKPK